MGDYAEKMARIEATWNAFADRLGRELKKTTESTGLEKAIRIIEGFPTGHSERKET